MKNSTIKVRKTLRYSKEYRYQIFYLKNTRKRLAPPKPIKMATWFTCMLLMCRQAGTNFIQAAKTKHTILSCLTVHLTITTSTHSSKKLEKVQIKRVDSDTADKLIDKGEKNWKRFWWLGKKQQVKTVFEKAINNKNMNITVESLAPDELPVIITIVNSCAGWRTWPKWAVAAMRLWVRCPISMRLQSTEIMPLFRRFWKLKLTSESYSGQAGIWFELAVAEHALQARILRISSNYDITLVG